MSLDISVQVANYLSENHLIGFTQSMKESLDGMTWELLIWDNSCADKRFEEQIKLLCQNVRWFTKGHNVGFARAHNELAKESCGKFLIIANPDLKVGKLTVKRLLETCETNQKLGLLVPAFYFPNGQLQPNQIAPQNIWLELAQTLFLDTLPFWNFGIPDLRRKLEEETPFPIGWGSGAFSLVPKSVWEKLRGYDSNFFFGGEDDDFCRRVWAAGWEVWCEPRAKVSHVMHGSIRRELDRKVMYYYQKRLYFAFKHFSRIQYYSLRAVSVCELCYKWIIGYILSIFNPSWKKKRQGYASTLRLLFSHRFKHPGEWVSEWIGS